jgi:hypothetical protein
MKNNQLKISLIAIFVIVSIIGFMIKLPRAFHHYDKELHASFYFFGFLFLSYLFQNRWALITLALAMSGVIIEYAQELSNKVTIRLIGRKIHGRFDIEDIRYNILGLALGVFVFLLLRRLIASNDN